jgi:hypothetical protein
VQGWRAAGEGVGGDALDYIEAAGAGRQGVAAIEAGLRAMVLAKPGVEEASGGQQVSILILD